jgi:hypothetical protein
LARVVPSDVISTARVVTSPRSIDTGAALH